MKAFQKELANQFEKHNQLTYKINYFNPQTLHLQLVSLHK